MPRHDTSEGTRAAPSGPRWHPLVAAHPTPEHALEIAREQEAHAVRILARQHPLAAELIGDADDVNDTGTTTDQVRQPHSSRGAR